MYAPTHLNFNTLCIRPRVYSGPHFSTISSASSVSLNPWFITGFADGESSFCISVFQSNRLKIGWRLQVSFTIKLHKKDRALLESIRGFFQVGNVSEHGNDAVIYQVRSVKELKVIIAHFYKFPLITQKRADSEFLKLVVEIMEKKNHVTIEGLHEILSIKASINNGLSPVLKEAFPNIIPVKRPLVVDQEIKHPYWLSGLVAAEGCFYVNINKLSSSVSLPRGLGYTEGLRFIITQHSRDEQLIRSLVGYLGCGNVYSHSNQEILNFVVSKLSDIEGKIIPFFSEYKIEGVKSMDFADFCEVAGLIKNKAGRTPGNIYVRVEPIRQIKAGMNKGRLSNATHFNANPQGIRYMNTQIPLKCTIDP